MSTLATALELGLEGHPFGSAYAASKFAIRGLALSAAAEYGDHGIRINTVCREHTSFGISERELTSCSSGS